MPRRAKGAAARHAKRASRTSPTKRKATSLKKTAGKPPKKHRRGSMRAEPARKETPAPTPAAVERSIETVIVDTVEEPMPGVVVVTETEYAVERVDEDDAVRGRAAAHRSRGGQP